MSRTVPAPDLMSAVDASLAAPFIDCRRHRQETNLLEHVHYVLPQGGTDRCCDGSAIRGRTKGLRSLDDVFRQMYDDFYVKGGNGSYYLKGRATPNRISFAPCLAFQAPTCRISTIAT